MRCSFFVASACLMLTGCGLAGIRGLNPHNPHSDHGWIVRYCWDAGARAVSECLEDFEYPDKWRRDNIPVIIKR
jgi:hypothetical protein